MPQFSKKIVLQITEKRHLESLNFFFLIFHSLFFVLSSKSFLFFSLKRNLTIITGKQWMTGIVASSASTPQPTLAHTLSYTYYATADLHRGNAWEKNGCDPCLRCGFDLIFERQFWYNCSYLYIILMFILYHPKNDLSVPSRVSPNITYISLCWCIFLSLAKF